MANFNKKTSKFFLTFFIGIIVISFMFTGYESMRGTPDTIAKVGNIPINAQEYQNEFERQTSFYKSLTGGRDLTRQQMASFKIQENAIANLITAKLWIKLANDFGIQISDEHIIDTVKKQPYFMTDNRFDFEKYKLLLNSNGYTTTSYESLVANDLKGQNARKLTAIYPLSKAYIQNINMFKNTKVRAHMIEIDKKKLRKTIPVRPQEIEIFFKNPENLKKTQELFNREKLRLDRPEKIRASHILLKPNPKKNPEARIKEIAKMVTPRNFARLANKYTEDPSGKGRGGSLGEFSRGRMVKEFEDVAFNLKPGQISKPVKTIFGHHLIYVKSKSAARKAKFSEHQNAMAKKIIREGKREELDKLILHITDQFQRSLKSGDLKRVERINNKYRFKFNKNVTIDTYNGASGSITLSGKDLRAIFRDDISKEHSYIFTDPTKHIVAQTFRARIDKKSPKDLFGEMEKEREKLSAVFGKKLARAIEKELRENTSIRVYSDRLRSP